MHTDSTRARLEQLSPEKRQVVEQILDTMRQAAETMPKHIQLLFVHTMPRAPKLTDSQGAWDHYMTEAEAHCLAFSDFCRALKRLNDCVERNLSGRVH